MASVYRAWQLLYRNYDSGSLRLGGKILKARTHTHTHIYSIPKGLVDNRIAYKQS